jgi:two-component system alkaline phosphatase synthesis response regulator PhoP
MSERRILVVEDEANIARLIRTYLEREGYLVREAPDGEAACDMLAQQEPDLVILDLMLPRTDGWEVCRRIRNRPGAQGRLPVIMLTARGEEQDRVTGLEIGADDYITKPFSPRELLARVRAVLRRAGPHAGAAGLSTPDVVLSFADFVINQTSRELIVRGQRLSCPAKEFDLLWLLATNPGRVLSRETLLEQVWEYEYLGDARTVDVHIRRLRQKIEPAPDKPSYIETVWGIGYKFVPRMAQAEPAGRVP